MKNILLVIILSFLVSSFSTAQTLQKIEQWDRFELPLQYKYNGNSFTDIRLSALFQNKDRLCPPLQIAHPQYIQDSFYACRNRYVALYNFQQCTGT